MKKSNKFTISNSNLVLILSVLLGIASVCMALLPAFTLNVFIKPFSIGSNGYVESYNPTGIQLSVGFLEYRGNGLYEKILNANFLSLIGYFLPIIAILTSIMSFDNKKHDYLPGLIYLVSSICLFLSLTITSSTLVKSNSYVESVSIGAGMLLSGLFSAIAGLIIIFKKPIINYISK